MPVRIAVVGTENRAQIETLCAIDDARIVAICASARNADAFAKAEILARKTKATAYRDCAALLKNEKPDAICVSVSSGKARRDAEILAIQNGIDIFLAPPFSSSVESAQTLLKNATQNRARLWISHSERFAESAESARKLLSPKSQKPNSVLGSWKLETNFLTSSTRLASLLRFLCGEIKSVQARANSVSMSLNLEFVSGILGAFVCDSNCENRLHFAAPNQQIEWRDLSLEIRRNNETQRIEYSKSPSREELRLWIQSVQIGRRTLQKSSPQDNLQTLRVALAIAQSAKTGKAVRLNI